MKKTNFLKILFLSILISSCSSEYDNELIENKNTKLETEVEINSDLNGNRLSTKKTYVLSESSSVSSLSNYNGVGLNLDRLETTHTYGEDFVALVLQSNGDLVLYYFIFINNQYTASPLWRTNTYVNNSVPSVLIAQNDGNLVLSQSSMAPYYYFNPVWSSNTTDGNYQSPNFKIQYIKITDSIGPTKYYARLQLFDGSTFRHNVCVPLI